MNCHRPPRRPDDGLRPGGASSRPHLGRRRRRSVDNACELAKVAIRQGRGPQKPFSADLGLRGFRTEHNAEECRRTNCEGLANTSLRVTYLDKGVMRRVILDVAAVCGIVGCVNLVLSPETLDLSSASVLLVLGISLVAVTKLFPTTDIRPRSYRMVILLRCFIWLSIPVYLAIMVSRTNPGLRFRN